MVHCNNGASELNAWAGLFAEFARAIGADADTAMVFETLFRSALSPEKTGAGWSAPQVWMAHAAVTAASTSVRPSSNRASRARVRP